MNNEYKTALRSLTKENRKTIIKMQHYLETCYLNEVVFEDMMNDLAGMALESQKRGEPFTNTIGMDYKSFCRELAENAKKQSFPERILGVMTWLCWLDGIFVPLLYILYAVFGFSAPALSGFTLTAPAGQLFMYFSVSTVLVIGWFISKHFTYSSQTVVFTAYMVIVLLTFLLTDFFGKIWFGDLMIKMNLIFWTVCVIVILLICYLAKRLIALSIAYKNRKK